MTIRFHFYSICREIAGASEMPFDLPERATLGTALDLLFHQNAKLGAVSPSCLFAIGTSYAAKDAMLSEGDVISMIPPMQGG